MILGLDMIFVVALVLLVRFFNIHWLTEMLSLSGLHVLHNFIFIAVDEKNVFFTQHCINF